MLLLNQISQHTKVTMPTATAAPGSLDHLAAQIALCEARYVIMEDLAELCHQLVFDQSDLLADCFDLIRLPSRVVWLEWGRLAGASSDDHLDKVGLIIRSNETGRRGTIQSVWELPGQVPGVERTRIAFDFDPVDDIEQRLNFRHAEHNLSAVLQHFWMEDSSSPKSVSARKRTAQAIWLTGPLVAAFCLLLLFKDEVEFQKQDTVRLNRKRKKLGRAPLLSHTQVHGRLFGNAKPSEGPKNVASTIGDRQGIRLHHVRGHFVRRGNVVFWRRPHLRGDPSFGDPITKTRLLKL